MITTKIVVVVCVLSWEHMKYSEEQKAFNTTDEYTHLLQRMTPAYNKKRCAFEMGIHYCRKTDFFQEDTTMSYSGFKSEPTRLQAEGHSHHTSWATNKNSNK
ncbi:hypothetical protein TNCV_490241 [Trichonephila clavipes]|nr:hypothetical protein TNCV_490241 [Trichonephila clavipes]